MKGRVITILSGKGGTGKTTVASNLGLTLAVRGYKTLLVDMNMGQRSLDLVLGVQNQAIYDIRDVILRTCPPETAILETEYSVNLFVLPTFQGEGIEEIHEEEIEVLISFLREHYEYIILDGGPGMGKALSLALADADTAVIVTTPDYVAVREAEALENHLIRRFDGNRHYLLNRMFPELERSGCEPTVTEIDQRFRCELLGTITEDMNIRASFGIGVPIVAKRDTYIAENFNRIVDRLPEEEA